MKLIKLIISAAHDGQVVSGTIHKQRFRNGAWIAEETLPYVSDTPEAERVILLEDNQRLVIEGTSNVKVVYDREQAAALPQAQPSKSRPPSTIDNDGEESPEVPYSEQARQGRGFLLAMQQEARARLITEARALVKKRQQSAGGTTIKS